MKALVIKEKNAPLTLQDVPDLTAGPGEAIVKIYSAALNHRDVWIQKGQYAGLRYPITPGSDGAGIVVSTGAPADNDWLKKEVIINPAMNWGNHQGYQDPAGFRILGLPDDGTMAQYVKVPVHSLVSKPAHLSFEEAAALPLAGTTAYRALISRAQVQPGEKVLITGIGGGVALFAAQFAIASGAEVYVTSGSDAKLEKARNLGVKDGANYASKDWVESLKAKAEAFDVIIDGACGDSMDALLDLAHPGARIVFYGATRGNPSGITARRIFWKQLNILGSTMGSPGDFQAMISMIQKHSIRPAVDKVFSMEEGEAAFRWMDDAGQFGKIVLKIN